MDTILQFAQTYSSEYEYSSSASDDVSAGVLVFLLGFYVFFIFLSLAIYIASSIGLMKIFNKAGVPGWAAWIPFFNNWKMLEIGGQQGFWAVLAIIPVVNIVSTVYLYIAMYHIGKKLGKDGAFLLWAFFVAPVWFLWLGFDKSTWNDSAATAPSLHQ